MILKQIILSIVPLLVLVITGLSQNKSLSFSEVADHLNLNKKTALAIKNYWNDIKGQEVTWKAEVVDVKGRRGKAEIYAANKDRALYKGFNIVLETFDVSGSAKLDIGQQIKFSGFLSDYKSRKGGPVVIYLNQVELK